MNNQGKKTAVTNTVFSLIVVVLLVLAASGFYLYSTGSGGSVTTTTKTSTTTVTSLLNQNISGGFVEGNLTTYVYTQPQICTPGITTFINNAEAQNASHATTCIVGAGNRTALAGAYPVFVLVPAFAGLSNFGVTQLGASSQGYPVFDNQVIVTQCGGGGSSSACPDHPAYLYSPDFTLVEQHLGITNGVFGLPEGVLPTPAHDHVAGFDTDASIPWYVIAVLVFDPNVFPNAVTGQCTQWVDSNLTAPTHNCLNSFSALQSAMNTHTSATANANATQDDPIYDTFGGVSAQVLIPGVTIISEQSPSNSNLFIYFSVLPKNPYA